MNVPWISIWFEGWHRNPHPSPDTERRSCRLLRLSTTDSDGWRFRLWRVVLWAVFPACKFTNSVSYPLQRVVLTQLFELTSRPTLLHKGESYCDYNFNEVKKNTISVAFSLATQKPEKPLREIHCQCLNEENQIIDSGSVSDELSIKNMQYSSNLRFPMK